MLKRVKVAQVRLRYAMVSLGQGRFTGITIFAILLVHTVGGVVHVTRCT